MTSSSSPVRRNALGFLAPLILTSLCACSSSEKKAAVGATTGDPTADMSTEITGANAPFMGAASGAAVPGTYVEHEYVAAGTATAYQPVGSEPDAQAPLSDDGLWTFETTTTATYRTRVLVRRPADTAAFSGTAIVEWLNVSGGVDANPDYASLAEEIVRKGHAWIGVSAQLIGVEGGPVLVSVPGGEAYTGKGLKVIDPERYATLSHPGDGYAFDIFTQVARAVRTGSALGGAKPAFVIAAGESQSAIALTTYYDGVQPITKAFDGFFVHSRGAVSLPLVGPGKYADLVGALGTAAHPVFRSDLDAPVLELQAESDVTGILNSAAVRQPESDRFRLWEVAGTAHADAHLIGSFASGVNCGAEINNGPMHIVAKASFNGLETWVRAGTLPPVAPRLEMTTAAPAAVARDADGIALGGIRTPPVDVPVDVLSGVPGPTPSTICILLGSTIPLPDTRITQLYTSAADYTQKYGASADQAIAAGFVLAPDRDALIAYSQPTRVP